MFKLEALNNMLRDL